MDDLKEQILTRDHYACRLCGRGAQEIHHIVSRRLCHGQYDYLLRDPRNLASLCFLCHHPSPSRQENKALLFTLRDIFKYDYAEFLFKERMDENG